MRNGYFYFLLLTVIILAGCRKNSLPPTSDEVPETVFYMKFLVNSFPVDIEAGVDNYYMFSSHHQDTSNVYVYSGELKQKDCGGSCDYGISILINDYRVSQPGGPMYADSGLYVGNYQFNDGNTEPAYYYGYFTPTYTLPGAPYVWSYSDGTQQTSFTGSHKFRAGKKYGVNLKINGSVSDYTLSNVYRVGNPLQCNVTMIKDTPATALRYKFTPLPSYYSPNANCVWRFTNNDNTYNYLNPLYSPSQLFPMEGYYNALLTLKDGPDTCEVNYQVPAFFNTLPNANYTSTFVPVPNYKNLSAVTFVVTDPAGHVYSSGMINQSTNSKVEIISVEDYKPNEAGEPTKKVKIRFNCSVKDLSNNNTLTITNGEAVIAVSYK